MPNAPRCCPRPTRPRGGVPYLVVAHYADGPKVTEHASKRAAHDAGTALRRAGVTAFAYPAALAQTFGHDARVALRGAA